MGDEAWMAEALAEAELAAREGEIPVGCVIVRDGQLVAEVVAIRRAAQALGCWKLSGCTMYVTLEPCPMCAGAISQARISRLIYGASDPAYGCAGSVYRIPEDPAFNHFCICDGGVLEADCRSLLENFFLRQRQ